MLDQLMGLRSLGEAKSAVMPQPSMPEPMGKLPQEQPMKQAVMPQAPQPAPAAPIDPWQAMLERMGYDKQQGQGAGLGGGKQPSQPDPAMGMKQLQPGGATPPPADISQFMFNGGAPGGGPAPSSPPPGYGPGQGGPGLNQAETGGPMPGPVSSPEGMMQQLQDLAGATQQPEMMQPMKKGGMGNALMQSATGPQMSTPPQMPKPMPQPSPMRKPQPLQ